MRTLREFAQFVGKPNDPISPRGLIDYLRLNIPTGSVSEMIRAFEVNSSPVKVEEILVGPKNGIIPFPIGMQVTKVGGYIFGIRWRILRNGQQVAVYDRLKDEPGFVQVAHTFSEAGTYTIEVTVKGIGSTGYAEATASTTVVAKPKPSPPLPQTKPSISVSAKGDGSFVVSGSGFLPNTTVHIRVVDDALATIFLDRSSTAQGTLNYTTGKLCQLPGKLHFSANDGRSDRNDLTGTLWSNTVTTTCS